MTDEVFRSNKVDLRKKAIGLKIDGVRNSKIGNELGLTKTQYLELFKPEKRGHRNRPPVKQPEQPKEKQSVKQSRPPKHWFEVLRARTASFQRAEPVNNRFSSADVIDRFGHTPFCYLTGKELSWQDPKSYELDHLHPRSKGGTGTLDNLRIATPSANRMKLAHLFEDFVKLCKQVAEMHP